MKYIRHNNKHLFIDGKTTPEIMEILKNKLASLNDRPCEVMMVARIYGVVNNEIIGKFASINLMDSQVIHVDSYRPTLAIVKKSDIDNFKQSDKEIDISEDVIILDHILNHGPYKYACLLYYKLTGNWIE